MWKINVHRFVMQIRVFLFFELLTKSMYTIKAFKATCQLCFHAMHTVNSRLTKLVNLSHLKVWFYNDIFGKYVQACMKCQQQAINGSTFSITPLACTIALSICLSSTGARPCTLRLRSQGAHPSNTSQKSIIHQSQSPLQNHGIISPSIPVQQSVKL